MKKILLFTIIAGMFFSCADNREVKQANFEVVPLPAEITLTEKLPFKLNASTKIAYTEGNDLLKRNAEFLATYLNQNLGLNLALTTDEDSKNAIVLTTGLEHQNKEAYQMVVNEERITITGVSEIGVFYGIQTLRKATPVGNINPQYSAGTITDYPRFGYRGMMLDVARHFRTVDFVKKYIDMLALHNINNFHFHLTEDQGWRIEIKAYPKLTEVGSKRSETVIGRNTGEYDGIPHEGFYTQEDIKEIVAYAKERYINVVPEIDLPGHMLAALASYPELGCTGGPYEVERRWGVFDDVLCAGQEKTYEFLETVLGEVLELFPSKYVHIGGDESPKVRWEKCPRCQAKIRELGLKSDKKHAKEFYLQSYVTERMEKFLNKNGRSLIGWDEILEGKLAPNATVMSWRGMAGGIEAAKLGHNVIMTPTTYVYFDYYQSKDVENEPLAIGGYLPLKQVYAFEPVPNVLTDEEKKHIIGAQANLWTEYVKTEEHAEYMVLPRMAALAETQWMQPEKKNYENFIERLPRLVSLYDLLGYNYAKHIFDVEATLETNIEKGSLDVTFSTIDDAPIYYTLDGSEPTTASTLYQGTISITKDADIKAVAIRDGKSSKVFKENVKLAKSSLKPIVLHTKPANSYGYTGAGMMNDGLYGTSTNYRTGRWMGFVDNDLVVTIDMKEPTEISTANIRTAVVTGDWIMDAKEIVVEASNDNKKFKRIKRKFVKDTHTTHWQDIVEHSLEFKPTLARYFKVTVKTNTLPKWHAGKGRKAFLFVDEIALN